MKLQFFVIHVHFEFNYRKIQHCAQTTDSNKMEKMGNIKNFAEKAAEYSLANVTNEEDFDRQLTDLKNCETFERNAT